MVQKHLEGTWKPVAFISRALSSTEEKYAQIEKEALATTWACERLADYLIGKTFHIETDHKPLVPLLGTKNLDEMPPRIQRLRMRLLRFDFTISISISLVRNSQPLMRCHVHPQSLRRGSSKRRRSSSHVDNSLLQLPASDKRLEEIAAAQKEDQSVESSLSIAKRDGQT